MDGRGYGDVGSSRAQVRVAPRLCGQTISRAVSDRDRFLLPIIGHVCDLPLPSRRGLHDVKCMTGMLQIKRVVGGTDRWDPEVLTPHVKISRVDGWVWARNPGNQTRTEGCNQVHRNVARHGIPDAILLAGRRVRWVHTPPPSGTVFLGRIYSVIATRCSLRGFGGFGAWKFETLRRIPASRSALRRARKATCGRRAVGWLTFRVEPPELHASLTDGISGSDSFDVRFPPVSGSMEETLKPSVADKEPEIRSTVPVVIERRSRRFGVVCRARSTLAAKTMFVQRYGFPGWSGWSLGRPRGVSLLGNDRVMFARHGRIRPFCLWAVPIVFRVGTIPGIAMKHSLRPSRTRRSGTVHPRLIPRSFGSLVVARSERTTASLEVIEAYAAMRVLDSRQ